MSLKSKKILSVTFALLMILAPMATVVPGQAVAQEGLDNERFSDVGDGLTIWDGSPLYLRAQTDTAATEIPVESRLSDRDNRGGHKVNIDQPIAGLGDLAGNRRAVGIFNDSHSNIQIKFDQTPIQNEDLLDPSDAGLEGRDVQVVVASFDDSKSTAGFNTLSTLGDVVSLGLNGDFEGLQNESETKDVRFDVTENPNGNLTDLSDGYQFDLSQTDVPEGSSGPHVVMLAIPNENTGGFSTDENNILTLSGDSEATLIGVEAFTIQDDESIINTDNEIVPGENISVLAVTPFDGNVNHSVLVYNQETFFEAKTNINISNDDIGSLGGENVVLEHEINDVNGVGEMTADGNIFGQTASARIVSGTTPLGDIVDRLSGEADLATDDDRRVVGEDITIDASGVTAPDREDITELSIETYGNWTPGTYRVIHAAEDGTAGGIATSSRTITIEEATPEPNFEISNLDPQEINVNTDENFDVSATVSNVGTADGIQQVSLFIFDPASEDEDSDIEEVQQNIQKTVSLENGSSTSVSFTDASVDDAGDYRYLITSANDSSVLGSLSVEEPDATPAPPNFQIQELDAPDTVTIGGTVSVDATIENTGGVESTQEISFSVDETDEETRDLTIAQGDTQTETFTYTTSSDDTPSIDLAVGTTNDTASTTVSVEEVPAEPEPANFQIQELDAPDTVTAGDTVSVDATIENTGGVDSTQEISFSVNETDEETSDLELAAGANETETFTYTTSSDDTPTIDVAVETANDTVSRTVSVTSQPPEDPTGAFFDIASVEAPEEVNPGDDVEVTATIENTGDAPATQDLALLADGAEEATTSVTLDTGETTEEILSYSVIDDASAQTDEVTVETANTSVTTLVDIVVPGQTLLGISANESSVVRGETVAFTITESGATTSATVSVPALDIEEPTGSDGVATIQFDSTGTFTVNADKEDTTATNFSTGETRVRVASPTLDITDSDGEFGDVAVGQSATNQLTIENNAPTAIAIDSVSVAGDNAGAFSIAQSDIPDELAPGEDTEVDLTFTSSTRDSAEAALNINDQTVALTGTGIAPEITIDSERVELRAEPGASDTESVSITNDGNAPLNADLSVGDRFSTQPGTVTVAAGETETIDITFEPEDGDNRRAVSELIASPDNDALGDTSRKLVGTVIDREIAIAAPEISLGNTTVGDETTAGVVVENPGTTTEELTPTVDGSAFSLVGDDSQFTLAAGDQEFLTIEATPTDQGEVTGTLSVETADGEISDSASIVATGQAPQLDIVSPDQGTLSFEQTGVGSATTENIQISNDGNAPLRVTADILEDSAFRVAGGTEAEIAPGETTSLPVVFSPEAATETTTALQLTTNDPETDQTSVTLAGEGIESDVALSSSTVAFGAVGVSSSTTETVTLENTGSAFTIEDISVSGDRFEPVSDPTGTELQEGDTEDIELRFDPTTSGSQTGTVTISGSTEIENEGSIDVSAALSGVGQIGELGVSSQTLRTGVTVSEESTSGSITIENTGPDSTELTVDEVSLADTEQFSIDSDGVTTGTTIAGGAAEPLGVTFTPQTTEDGVEETTLTLEASSGEGTFSRTVTVTGTVSAPDPTISTDEISVGTLSINESADRTVTVSNDGGEPYTITDVTVDGDGVTAEQVGATEIVPGGEADIDLTVGQQTAGTIDTTVEVTTTAEDNPTVAVTGDVVAPEFSLQSTDQIEFGNTPAGSASQQAITIENTGEAPLTVAEPTISGSDSFAVITGDQQLRIASGSSETITVGFAPSATEQQTATLTLDPINDPATETQEISLTGTGTESNVQLSDPRVGFGTISLGDSATQTLELTNEGEAPLSIGGSSVLGSDSDAVSVNGLQQRTLDAGESEAFEINVDTTDAERGSLAAQVSVATSDTTVTSSVGATAASPQISTDSVVDADSFGSIRVGDTATANVEVRNTGNAELELTDIETIGADEAAFTTTDQPTETISPQSSAQIGIEFEPAALQNAAARAQNTPLEASTTLEIDHNAGSTESVSLTGKAETAALTTPRTFRFGETPIGETTTRTLTIENAPAATTSLTITGIELSGSDDNEYDAALVGGPTVTLEPGQTTTVDVSLTPESIDRKFATFGVETDDPRQTAQKVGLSNAETAFTVEYGSVTVPYINPTSGQEPIVDVDRGLRGQNATVTSTTSDVDRTSDYELDYEFGTTAAEAGGQTALEADTPVQYINATTTAQPGEFNDSTIQIEVSKAVLASQNATPDNVTIYHEAGDGYNALETTRLFETTQGHVYEVTTDSYSLFAVGIESSDGDDGGGNLARFDTDDSGTIERGEAIDAISAFNGGNTIGGESVTRGDAVDVIAAFNSGEPVDGDNGDSGGNLARFDTDDSGTIERGEAVDAISAFNGGNTIGGEPVTRNDAVDVIAAFNSGRSIGV